MATFMFAVKRMMALLVVAIGVAQIRADSDGIIKTRQSAEVRKMYSIAPLYAMEAEGKNRLAAFFEKQGVAALSPEQFVECGRDAFALSASPETHEKITAALLRFQSGRHYRDAFGSPVNANPGAAAMVEKQWKLPAVFFEGRSFKVPRDARGWM